MKKSFVISFSLIIAIIASVFNLSGTGNIVTADKALGSGVTYKQIKADSTYNKLQFDIINTQTPGNTVNDKEYNSLMVFISILSFILITASVVFVVVKSRRK